jgi:Cu+-exporting ATPase
MPFPSAPASTRLQLDITGMTCAACAARIEKKLNRLDGVSASVNYATGKATIERGGGDAPTRLDLDDPAVVERLIEAVESIGYGAHVPAPPAAGEPDAAEVHLAGLRRRLVVAAVLGVPVVVVSMAHGVQFDGWYWWAIALAVPVVTWCAWPFHRAALLNLRHLTATMDTLISVGVTAAFVWSVWAATQQDRGSRGAGTGGGHDGMAGMGGMNGAGGDAPHIYVEVAVAVTVLILLGKYLEARAKRRAGSALRALLDLGAKDVAVLDADGTERRIPAGDLRVGERFVVRPGEKIATDGTVVDGASAVDTSLVTGESVPVDVGPGSGVVGATVNTTGRLVVEATRVGADTQLAQMARLVEEAQSGKAEVQRLADRVAAVFVPVVIAIAVATLVAWLVASGDVEDSFTAAVAVLIIACPCALGLATPTALLVGTGRGAQLGILIKGPEILESTRRIDTIVLDKTGTVTSGQMSVVDVVAAPGVDRDGAFARLAALEHASEHPAARAIAGAAPVAVGATPGVAGFRNLPGLGVEGTVDGVDVVAGRPALLRERGFTVDPSLDLAHDHASARGLTVIAAGWDGAVQLVVAVGDTPRPSSRAAIERLRGLGLTPVLLTGDNATTARAVAADVGIDDVIADVLPADKVAVVRRLQDDGRVVAMVGDGVNDAAALAQADLGIAMGSGTDVAIEASDLTLVRVDLHAAADAIRLARRTLSTIKGNLFWAFAYNVAAIPLAAAGVLNPIIASAAMACSSLFVLTNSLRLRRFTAQA